MYRAVFGCGVPRTGTTLLSNLRAADPHRRSPLTWEIDDPVPPPATATLRSDPRAVARLAQEKAMLAARPEMGKYYRNSAIYPNECMFRSEEHTSELQSLMRISYAVFCLKKKQKTQPKYNIITNK